MRRRRELARRAVMAQRVQEMLNTSYASPLTATCSSLACCCAASTSILTSCDSLSSAALNVLAALSFVNAVCRYLQPKQLMRIAKNGKHKPDFQVFRASKPVLMLGSNSLNSPDSDDRSCTPGSLLDVSHSCCSNAAAVGRLC